MAFQTADLCDAFGKKVQVVQPGLQSYGSIHTCSGPVVTVSLDEDNGALVKLLQQEGKGRVVVVDAKGAYCAIVGDTLMGYAEKNDWRGIIVNGYVRDIQHTRIIPVGLWALGTCPMKSNKKSEGIIGEEATFLGVIFHPGDMLYADSDGIIVSREALI